MDSRRFDVSERCLREDRVGGEGEGYGGMSLIRFEVSINLSSLFNRVQ